MSDEFEMLVDVDVSLKDAPTVCKQVVDRLRELKLITGRLTKECVLGKSGYMPGPGVAQAYRRDKREHDFRELKTCGVEPEVGRHFNVWALGEACEGFVCPKCGEAIDAFDEKFGESLNSGLTLWSEQASKAPVACLHCRKKTDVTKWHCHPPLGFGNLSFSFWNWPPLNSPSWQINIPAIVREVTGHTIVESYGHV
ncbi:hypothetical protein [Anatilimnocola floriformis]|uniref:hypothetical protein n=1 Tax=Anatilimnocola floriformis TaxID=2948575 RepID=UPI0020C20B03|nr:hypothetical protein [Anatilimnocola floriformis]